MTSKTIALSGAEIRVNYSGGSNAWLRNDGTSVVYAAATPGVVAGADGVVSIPAGSSAPVYGANGTVYLFGTGSVQLIGSDYSSNPFKTSAQSGGSGADEVARAAITAHADNADIHVTTAEKAVWNAKAELSDIPAALPADGGNADTVDGKHAGEFMQYLGNLEEGSLLDHVLTMTASGWIISTNNVTDVPVPGQFFWVEVRADKIGDYCVTATRFNNPSSVYTNRYNGGLKAWYGWANTADGGDADTVGGIPADNLYTSRALSTDANKCLKNGNYMFAPGSSNVPLDCYALLSVEVSGDGTWVIQRYTNVNNPLMSYVRSIVNGAFGEWHSIGGAATQEGGTT